MTHLVTASDISYINEFEGISSLANVVFQNQAYAREKMTDDIEELFKNAGFRKKIRDVIGFNTECKEKTSL